MFRLFSIPSSGYLHDIHSLNTSTATPTPKPPIGAVLLLRMHHWKYEPVFPVRYVPNVMQICVPSWSANRIEPRVRPIEIKHATLEIGSTNNTALYSHECCSQSALAITMLWKWRWFSNSLVALQALAHVVCCGRQAWHNMGCKIFKFWRRAVRADSQKHTEEHKKNLVDADVNKEQLEVTHRRQIIELQRKVEEAGVPSSFSSLEKGAFRGSQQRSEDQWPDREEVIRLNGWLFKSIRTASAENGSNRLCGTCSQGCRPDRETGVLCCIEELLPNHHAEAGNICL